MRLSARRIVPVVLGAAVASCENGLEPRSMCACPPTVTLHPASLTMAAGDSAPLTVALSGALGVGTIRLASRNPAVARVDSVAQSGVPVIVRAVGAGGTAIDLTVTAGGQSLTGAMPVTVTARPTP
jgi:hypothetical protein